MAHISKHYKIHKIVEFLIPQKSHRLQFHLTTSILSLNNAELKHYAKRVASFIKYKMQRILFVGVVMISKKNTKRKREKNGKI